MSESKKTVEVASDLHTDEPFGYVVFDKRGEWHQFEVMSDADAFALDQVIDDDDLPDKWPIYPLWPGVGVPRDEYDGVVSFRKPEETQSLRDEIERLRKSLRSLGEAAIPFLSEGTVTETSGTTPRLDALDVEIEQAETVLGIGLRDIAEFDALERDYLETWGDTIPKEHQ